MINAEYLCALARKFYRVNAMVNHRFRQQKSGQLFVSVYTLREGDASEMPTQGVNDALVDPESGSCVAVVIWGA